MQSLNIENLDIYITGKCNYKCEYCYGENDKCGDMSQDVFDKALEFGKYINVKNIQFCGGEPLVARCFEKFTLQAKKTDFNVVLRTNGFFLDKYLEFVAKNCSWVGISIDGLPKENALMRTSRSNISIDEQFNKPISAIGKLKELNPNIKIILASLASKINYKQLPDFAEYLNKHKVKIDKWKIYEFLVDKFRSVDNKDKFEMTDDMYDWLVNNMPDKVNGVDIMIQSSKLDRVNGNCLIVYQNGDITILGKNYGNILETDFDDIIKGLLMDNAINAIIKNKKETYEDIKNDD